MSDKTRYGYVCAISAQVIWGLFPIYVDALKDYDAFGFVAHRAVWSFLFLLLVFGVAGYWKAPFLPAYDELTSALKPTSTDRVTQTDSEGSEADWAKRKRRKVLWLVAVAAILICVNWVGFVWAAINDHKLDASLGYYICPQVVVLLGVIFLGERLKPIQWLGFAVAACGVGYMVRSSASMPSISLLIAFSFGFYALAKKQTKMPALSGLTFETGFLTLPAIIFLAWQCGYLGLPTDSVAGTSGLTLFTDSWLMNILLVCSGMMTIAPLALYATAVKHIPLSTIGLLQFIGPTIQFCLGLFVYHEPFDKSRFYGFVVVWIGVAIYLFAVRSQRPSK